MGAQDIFVAYYILRGLEILEFHLLNILLYFVFCDFVIRLGSTVSLQLKQVKGCKEVILSGKILLKMTI